MDWEPMRFVALPLTNFFDIGNPRSLISLLGCVIFTVLTIIFLRLFQRNRRLSGRTITRFIMPKRVFLHPSSVLDYKLYVVNTFVMSIVAAIYFISADFWQGLVSQALTWSFGAPPKGGEPSVIVFLITTSCMIIALDFGYWVAHYAFHKNPILWEFHKVHHSAEVMTPATELRQHPVELLGFPLVDGLTSGTTYAFMIHLFGQDAQLLGLYGMVFVMMIHLVTFHHLRHSHVNMYFSGLWGVVFHSPAHHKVHHSASPEHFDKNLGFLFNIWDWIAGTLYQPKKNETIQLGIGSESSLHDSVASIMWLPVKNALRLVRSWLRN